MNSGTPHGGRSGANQLAQDSPAYAVVASRFADPLCRVLCSVPTGRDRNR